MTPEWLETMIRLWQKDHEIELSDSQRKRVITNVCENEMTTRGASQSISGMLNRNKRKPSLSEVGKALDDLVTEDPDCTRNDAIHFLHKRKVEFLDGALSENLSNAKKRLSNK